MMTETLAQIHYHKYRPGNQRPSSPKTRNERSTSSSSSSNPSLSTSNSTSNGSLSGKPGAKTASSGSLNGKTVVKTVVKKETTTIMKVNSAANMTTMTSLSPSKGQFKRGGSFVVGQKLRESKWFGDNERAIFCAVVETGFIVEQKDEEEKNQYGIAVWTLGFEKSKNPDHLTIYTLINFKGKAKVTSYSLQEFWPPGTSLRINNKSDKTEKPLEESIIRNQITFSLSTKRKWHNSEHYAYYCRYGPPETHFRVKKITDHLKWDMETFFMKIRSLSTKQ